MPAAKQIAFGPFRLDFTNECLWQGMRAIHLRPKAFAVLKLLIESPGQLVNKQLVLDTVWPGTFVGDAVLKDNIRQLREALEDDAGTPKYIETAHRRGYRFIGILAEPAPKEESSVPVQAHVPQAARKPATAAPPAACVLGREAELAKMHGWLNRALMGERQTVFITGEAGIGKTTLVQGFLQQASQAPEALVISGQCLEYFGSGEPYMPVLDGLTRICRSSGGAGVLEMMRRHAPSWLAHISALTPSENNVPPSQPVVATRERMLREIAEAIERLAAKSPLLLVLEDLHWSDYATLDLISYLSRRRDPARLMVIGTYRPVDVILNEHPLKGVKRELQAHRLCQELPLEYLTEDVIAKYLNTRFPGHQLPTWLRRTIYRRTEGNPLFMVNLVEYLIDQKVIVEGLGTWKLCADLSEVEQGVPSNLRDLIQKQIERLSPDERSVLEAASVAGSEPCATAIAAGLEMPVELVEKLCEELARRHHFLSSGWLVELPDGTVTPRHRFNHMLFREVPYSLMSPTRRAQIHRRIGEHGIIFYKDRTSEIAAELAMHFEQSRDWPRALQYLLQAAQNAAAGSAHHEATDLARRGLEALKNLPETEDRVRQEITLRMLLGTSLISTKGFASAEVEEVFARGRELSWQQGPSPELFQMLWALSLYYQFGGQVQASFKIVAQLLDLAEGLKSSPLIMEANRAMGGVLVVLGRSQEALKHLDHALDLYPIHRRHGMSRFLGYDCKVITETFAARALWVLGKPDLAVERANIGLQLARELGHPQSLVIAGYSAAQIHQLRGEAALVRERTQEATDLADEYGLDFWLTYGVMLDGWAEAELGNAEKGIAQMKRGLAAYETAGARLWSPYFLGLLADQFDKAGRVDEGLTVVSRALTCAARSGEAYSLSELHRIKGELLIKVAEEQPKSKPSGRAGRDSEQNSAAAQAQSCFTEALAIAKQQHAVSWEQRAYASMERITSVGRRAGRK